MIGEKDKWGLYNGNDYESSSSPQNDTYPEPDAIVPITKKVLQSLSGMGIKIVRPSGDQSFLSGVVSVGVMPVLLAVGLLILIFND